MVTKVVKICNITSMLMPRFPPLVVEKLQFCFRFHFFGGPHLLLVGEPFLKQAGTQLALGTSTGIQLLPLTSIPVGGRNYCDRSR